MFERYSFLKIDQKRYPVFSNIKALLTQSDRRLIKKEFQLLYPDVEKGLELCKRFKKLAIIKKDEYSANFSFILKLNFMLIENIAKFWENCENNQYNKSWDFLQTALNINEELLCFLEYDSAENIRKSFEYLSIIEKLYPYKLFASSGIDKMEVICSICEKSPLHPDCNHVSGQLYWGEMAIHIVTKILSVNHVALTGNPKDKRCIIFLEYNKQNPEDGPFQHIHSFIRYSKRPLKDFKFEKTVVERPRSEFIHWIDSLPCPCDSGISFKECCYNKESIKIPHYNFIFND